MVNRLELPTGTRHFLGAGLLVAAALAQTPGGGVTATARPDRSNRLGWQAYAMGANATAQLACFKS